MKTPPADADGLLSAQTGVPRTPLQTLLLASGFGGILFAAVYLLLGAIAPNYNPIRDTISALEFTSLSLIQRANFFLFGILLCAFAAGLRSELKPGWEALVIPLFQLLSGIAVIGDAIFIHDPLHLVCDLFAFNSGLIVLFVFAWRVRHDSRWKRWTAYSIATAFVMAIFLTAFGLANQHGGPAGLMEKIAASMRTLWSAILAGMLLAGAQLDQSQIPSRAG